MREKRTKPSRSVRYLLSADRRLQKLSLKKLSARVGRGKARPHATHTKAAEPTKVDAVSPATETPTATWRPSTASWVILGGVVLIGAAAAFMPSGPAGEQAVAASVDAPRAAVAPASRVEPRKPVAAKPVTPPAPVAAKQPAEAPKVTTAVEPVDAPPASDIVAAASAAPPVTITGCLERDGDAFWLKDTSGADAPKSRSWKTGFLKKRSSRVAIVDAANALRLPAHVGERVAVTGTLLDRELHARWLKRVAAACN